MALPVFSLIQGIDFDCTATEIQVRADRVGAEVHEIKVAGRSIRVLAHSDAAAQSAAAEWLAAQGPTGEELPL